MIPEDTIEQKTAEKRSNQLDRRKISPDSKIDLKEAIEQIEDDAAKEALAHLFEILTGDEIQE